MSYRNRLTKEPIIVLREEEGDIIYTFPFPNRQAPYRDKKERFLQLAEKVN